MPTTDSLQFIHNGPNQRYLIYVTVGLLYWVSLPYIPSAKVVTGILAVLDALDEPKRKEYLAKAIRGHIRTVQGWDVSGESIQRDLRWLANLGIIERVVVGPRGKVAYVRRGWRRQA